MRAATHRALKQAILPGGSGVSPRWLVGDAGPATHLCGMLTMTKAVPKCVDHDVNFMIGAGVGDARWEGWSGVAASGGQPLSEEWPGKRCAAGSIATAALLTAVAASPNPVAISRT